MPILRPDADGSPQNWTNYGTPRNSYTYIDDVVTNPSAPAGWTDAVRETNSSSGSVNTWGMASASSDAGLASTSFTINWYLENPVSTGLQWAIKLDGSWTAYTSTYTTSSNSWGTHAFSYSWSQSGGYAGCEVRCKSMGVVFGAYMDLDCMYVDVATESVAVTGNPAFLLFLDSL